MPDSLLDSFDEMSEDVVKFVSDKVVSKFRTVAQLLTEEVTTVFLCDLLDFEITEEPWNSLNELEKHNAVIQACARLDNEGKLVAAMRSPKRVFVSTGDDEEIPKLPNRVTCYRLKR